MQELQHECPPFMVNFVRDRVVFWASNENKRRGILSRLLHTRSVPIPYAAVRQFSDGDLNLVACKGNILGQWLITISEIRTLKGGASDPSSVDNLLEETKVMVFDFVICDDASKFIVVETDLNDHTTRGLYDLASLRNPNSLLG